MSMGRLTLSDLRELRESKRKSMQRRETGPRPIEVVVGMATCGIAAGAKETFDAFLDELETSGIGEVEVRQTGCMGLCHAEPTVEVEVEGMPRVIYGKVDGETARRIVRRHIVGKQLIDDHLYDRPAADNVADQPTAKK